MHVRVCPDCGEEYRPEIATCADCGATLEDRYEDEEEDRDLEGDAGGVEGDVDPRAGIAAESASESVEYARLFTADSAKEIEPLARQLGQAGIRFWVRPNPLGLGFHLYVRRQDGAEALRKIDGLLPAGARPAEYLGEEPASAVATSCPACESEVPPGVGECPDCGLVVRQPEMACEDCGRHFEAGQTRCAGCGRERPD